MKTSMKTSIMRSLSTLVAAATSASLGAWITVGLLSSSLYAADDSAKANEAAKKMSRNAKGDVIAVGNAGLSLVLGGKPSPAEKRATELLAERLKERAALRWPGRRTRTRCGW